MTPIYLSYVWNPLMIKPLALALQSNWLTDPTLLNQTDLLLITGSATHTLLPITGENLHLLYFLMYEQIAIHVSCGQVGSG